MRSEFDNESENERENVKIEANSSFFENQLPYSDHDYCLDSARRQPMKMKNEQHIEENSDIESEADNGMDLDNHLAQIEADELFNARGRERRHTRKPALFQFDNSKQPQVFKTLKRSKSVVDRGRGGKDSGGGGGGKSGGKPQYEVDYIWGKRLVKNGKEVQYKVCWKDYPLEESTWEPESNLRFCHETIKKFEEREPYFGQFTNNNHGAVEESGSGSSNSSTSGDNKYNKQLKHVLPVMRARSAKKKAAPSKINNSKVKPKSKPKLSKSRSRSQPHSSIPPLPKKAISRSSIPPLPKKKAKKEEVPSPQEPLVGARKRKASLICSSTAAASRPYRDIVDSPDAMRKLHAVSKAVKYITGHERSDIEGVRVVCNVRCADGTTRKIAYRDLGKTAPEMVMDYLAKVVLKHEGGVNEDDDEEEEED